MIHLFDVSNIPADCFVSVARLVALKVAQADQMIAPELINFVNSPELNVETGGFNGLLIGLGAIPWVTTQEYLNLHYVCMDPAGDAAYRLRPAQPINYGVRRNATYAVTRVDELDDDVEWCIQGAYGESLSVNGFMVQNLQRLYPGDYICRDPEGVWSVISPNEFNSIFTQTE
jgi:hypothetical protein